MQAGLRGRRRPSADRLPVHPSMWTMDQDYHLKVDEWTDFLPWTVHLMDEFGVKFGAKVTFITHSCRWLLSFLDFLLSDRPSHGQIRTLDQDYHLKVDEWTDFWRFFGRIRAKDDKFHQMDGGGRADEWMDERSTNYFPWRLFIGSIPGFFRNSTWMDVFKN